MVAYKKAVWLMILLSLAVLLATVCFSTDKPESLSHNNGLEESVDSEPDTSPAPETSTLSDNAEYPTPVIELQQLLADGVKQQTPVLTHSSDFQDNKTDLDTDDIEALRQRLSALKAQNNNN